MVQTLEITISHYGSTFHNNLRDWVWKNNVFSSILMKFWIKYQKISKAIYGTINSQKNKKKSTLQYYDTSCRIFSVLFLEVCIEDTINWFKIYWPLVTDLAWLVDPTVLLLLTVLPQGAFLTFTYLYNKPRTLPVCMFTTTVGYLLPCPSLGPKQNKKYLDSPK